MQNNLNQQAQINTTKLNNINQVNPLGQVNYTGTPGQEDYTQTTTLNPQLQQILSQVQGAGVNAANNLQTNKLDLSKLAGGANVANDYAPIQDSFNMGKPLQYNIADAGGIRAMLGALTRHVTDAVVAQSVSIQLLITTY
jgi:hypothetical protein